MSYEEEDACVSCQHHEALEALCVCVYVCLQTQTHTCRHTHTNTFVCVCVRTWVIYIYIYMYTIKGIKCAYGAIMNERRNGRREGPEGGGAGLALYEAKNQRQKLRCFLLRRKKKIVIFIFMK